MPENERFQHTDALAYCEALGLGDSGELAGRIEAADSYVMVSAEFNHTISPAGAERS